MRLIIILIFCLGLHTAMPAADAKPNIVVVIADDLRTKELGCYGGTNVKTPHIDQLATEGMRFSSAYASEAMCATMRAALYTGIFPVKNGCYHNHGTTKASIQSVVQRLGKLGYRVGLAGKRHFKPTSVYPFENVPGFEPKCTKITSDYDVAGITAFMKQNEPFCLFVCSTNPHRPWTLGDASQFDQKALKLPAHYVDIPETRAAFADYLAEITVLDQEIHDVDQALSAVGKRDNTIFIFAGEQGAQFPGAKWTLWDEGVHTGFIVRWPGVVKAGSVSDALIQYEDVLPTFIDSAGGAAVPELDGTSFKAVLLGQTTTHRTYVYGVHNNVPEGRPYPIRSIFDGRYRLLWNLKYTDQYHEKHLMDGNKPPNKENYWHAWVEAAKNDMTAKKYIDRYMIRPEFELYDTSTDRAESNNLAGNPEYDAVQKKLFVELQKWMQQQNDPGAELDVAK